MSKNLLRLTAWFVIVFMLMAGLQAKSQPTIYRIKANDMECYYLTTDISVFEVTWTGRCADSLLSGYGTLTAYENEDPYFVFVGTLENGMESGNGQREFPQYGITEKGNFKNGKLDGYGTQIFSQGSNSTYTGNFKNGLRHGQGVLQSGSNRFNGEFENNVFVRGRVSRTYFDGSKYEGAMEGDLRQGLGTYYFANGDVYTGNFDQGNINGFGTMEFASGNKYQGNWQDGLRHGFGTFEWNDGSKYVGNWQNGLYHNNGTLTSADGSSYAGNWNEGKKNGTFTLTDTNGVKSERIYQRDSLVETLPEPPSNDGTISIAELFLKQYARDYDDGIERDGRLELPNGDVFVGIWRGNPEVIDDLNGEGTLTGKNGGFYRGTFVNGMLNGEGTITYPDGGRYIGAVYEFKPHGRGIMFFVENRSYQGDWHHGEMHGQGVLTFSDGKRLTGEFRDGKPYNATLVFPDGDFNRAYINGVRQ